jgi:acyl carrier protein
VLVGYVTGPDPTLDTTAVRRSLSLRLPQRLVPEHLLVVEELPLTAVGDYDLDALLDIVPHGGGTDDYVAPRTPLEHDLTGILQELLGAERVGVLDSFFELGGFSLLATQLATRIRESFGVELSLRDVFEAPTVDRLAQLIVQRQVELSGARDLAALLDEIEGSDPGSG